MNFLNFKMKILTQYDETCEWLRKCGFNNKDIKYIKKIYDKEGIMFCIKSFRENELNEIKEELNNIYKKENYDYCKELISSVSNVDIDEAMRMLMV